MDLRSAIALGFASGFAVTATPALVAKVVDKSPRTKLDAPSPSEATSTPVQAPETEDFAPPKYDNDAILDGGVGDQPRRTRRVGNR